MVMQKVNETLISFLISVFFPTPISGGALLEESFSMCESNYHPVCNKSAYVYFGSNRTRRAYEMHKNFQNKKNAKQLRLKIELFWNR